MRAVLRRRSVSSLEEEEDEFLGAMMVFLRLGVSGLCRRVGGASYVYM